MDKLSNVDLLITLSGHGWSMVCVTVDCQIFDFQVTHIFNNPYADAMDALLQLVKGFDSSFFWFDEPLGIKIEMKMNQSQLVTFSIYEVEKVFYKEIEDKDLTLVKSFNLNLRQLLLLFYYQFKKVCVLLEDKEYAQNRSHDFPFQEFREFENITKKMYKV